MSRWSALAIRLACAALACLLLHGAHAHAHDAPPAELLHALFQDHAVLQRDAPLRLWGRASPGQRVEVSFAGAASTTRAGADGAWETILPARVAGGPHVLVVKAGEAVRTVRDLWIGDVWLCAGQSNMELPVWRSLDAASEIASATDAGIRLFTVPRAGAIAPQSRFREAPRWQVASPESVRDFSAACFYFARELRKTIDVPMGLIQAAWGGSRIEAWTSAEALRADGQADEDLQVLSLYATDVPAALAKWGARWQRWWMAREETMANDAPWRADASADPAWRKAPDALGAWERWGVPGLAAYDGMMWYRTQVELTAAQAARGAVLELGPADETDMTWVNGVAVGSSDGAGEPRAYGLPPGVLREGANSVVVNVLDTYRDGGLAGPLAAHALRFDDGTRVILDQGWRYRPAPGADAPPRAPWQAAAGMSTLYNGMIAPLGHYGLRGMLWYQGESNTGGGPRYAAQLRMLRASWRAQLGEGLPMLVVQLAGYGMPPSAPRESGWAEVREAQRRVVAEDPRSGLAIAVDIGDAYDIHPPNKQELARRLAHAARHVIYGERALAPSGPVPRGARRTPDAVVVTFDGVTEALSATGANGPIGFELCGRAAGSCRYAEAAIDGDRVVLAAPRAGDVDRVRYCWADGPICTLRDAAGLPAGPFELSLNATGTP